MCLRMVVWQLYEDAGVGSYGRSSTPSSAKRFSIDTKPDVAAAVTALSGPAHLVPWSSDTWG